MNRTILLLGLAALVFVVMSIVAFLLKLTFALGLIVVAAIGVIALAVWWMLRTRRSGPYG